MGTLAFALIALLLMAIPSRDHLRSALATDDYRGMDCELSTVDGRRSQEENAYAPRADLDLHSSDRLLHCKQMILPRGLRSTRLEMSLQNSQELADSTVQALQLREDWKDRLWTVHVLLGDKKLRQKISFALQTQLAMNRFAVQAGSEKDDAFSSSEAWRTQCKDLDLPDDQAALIVFQEDRTHTALKRAVCTQGSWEWL